MAPIRSTKFGFNSLFADKVETDNNFIAIRETNTANDSFEPGNGYRYLVFTSPGNLYVNKSGRVDILLVGGGGAGGHGELRPSPAAYFAGGGGGAGGFYETMAFNLPVGDYDISIGAGGAVSSGPFNAQPGTNRNGSPGTPTYISGPTITDLIAYGGGGGAGSFDTPPNKPPGFGSDGGSGGGSNNNNTAGIGNRTTAIAPATGSSIPTYLQGHRVQGHPGNGNGTTTLVAGGGGGAGSAAYFFIDGSVSDFKTGGDGRPAWSGDDGIPPTYGTPGPAPGRWFAGGGGGGSAFGIGVGGSGGGGDGADARPPGVFDGSAGTVNTGGGGGGGNGSSKGGYAGGPGIVILRYKIV